MVSLIFELGIILVLATIAGLIGRTIKQPLLIAYIITGILISPLIFNLNISPDMLTSFAHIGVALLLFSVGISLDFRTLKSVGKASVIGGISTMILMAGLTWIITSLLGFDLSSAIYMSIAFTFSSTVVVVKVLSDKREKDTLHGRIAIGILVMEAFIAAIVLIILPVASSGSLNGLTIQLGKAAMLIAGLFLVGKFGISKIASVAARNQELLFLFSLSWALLGSLIFELNGLSLEIGALVAGMVLASSKYSLEMGGKIAPVRDLFVIIFFVFFGSQIISPISASVLLKATVLSAVVLIAKPIILMSFMRSLGYNKRTNFLAGASLAQVSELSLIVILIGASQGLVSSEAFSVSILVAIATIAISSYTMYFSESIYQKLSRVLSIFDGKGKEEIKDQAKYDIILIGYDRLGYNILKAFHAAKKKYLIIDYNPSTVLKLTERNIPCIYGDVRDTEFLENLNLEKAKLVLSTAPDLDVNTHLLNFINSKKTAFIATSHDINNSIELYKKGADYVIMPHFLGGEFMANMLMRDKFSKKEIQKDGKEHIKELQDRLSEGHKHPKSFY
ncbi:MAG: cation:proton antiporter [Candidatus Pacearchaeota archaeon]